MKFISVLGLIVMMLIAWSISSDRKRMNFRLIFSGVTIQFIFALLILKTAPGEMLFRGARVTVAKIIGFSDAGAQFVFGPAFKDHFFAFSVLPTIIFVSAVMALLFHLGIMQFIVKGIAKVMVWVMDTSGSESLAAAANIFIGQTEAPLVIKPYISTMTSSELMAMMTSGMATVAGGVMAAYAGLGADAGHLLAASIMSAPASLVIAKIIIPEKEISPTKGVVKLDIPRKDANMLDAAC
ncbi:NupC/NupG family nucleoside CNT transporter, partial [bacterium]|nr:NupC/NupG family nucleoside CNT transporter [bacterium]